MVVDLKLYLTFIASGDIANFHGKWPDAGSKDLLEWYSHILTMDC